MMKAMIFAAPVAVFVSLQGSVAAAHESECRLSETDEAAIRSVMESYRTEWLDLDADGLMDLFAEDAVLSPNGRLEAVEGRAGARAFWFPEGESPFPLTQFELTVLQIDGCKDFAALRGLSDVRWEVDGQPGRGTGAFSTNLRKLDGRWRITFQMWDSAATSSD